MSSRDSSKDKFNPFLAALNESMGSHENDESVHAPTRKLPSIPLQLSQLYENDSSIEELSIEELSIEDLSVETELVEEKSFSLVEDPSNAQPNTQSNTQSNSYQPSLKVTLEPNTFELKEFKSSSFEPSSFELNTFESKEFEPEQNMPSFEVKVDPNSNTAKFEKDTLLKEQLESVDFYIEQGFLDVAFSTLERLEMVFPGHPLISERLEKMASLEIKNTSQGIPVPTLIKEPSSEIPAKTDPNLSESMFRVPNTAELLGVSEIAPSEPETEMDFKSLVTDNIAPDNDKKLEQPANEETTFSEMPAELYQTITDDEEIENILNQVDTAAAEIAAIQNGLGSLIDEPESDGFEQDVDEEFAGHFTIGQAYFDIELFDDAVEEFQAAYRSIQHLGATPKMFQCCVFLGKCFRLKEMPRPALIWLKKAFDTKEYQQSDLLELLYQLAGTHEELGEQKKALDFYQQIAKIAPDYQDTSQRISNLNISKD